MSKLIINGGKKLYGSVTVSGAKNSVLPIMCASILNEGETFIKDCPVIDDVTVLAVILRSVGAVCRFCDGGLYINAKNVCSYSLPELYTEKLRASLFTVGALLGRLKRAEIYRTGGCRIGTRPIDLHINGLTALGVKVEKSDDRLNFSCGKMKGAKIRLSYPSVGATENLIMAAVLGEGSTVISNAAREPEICDLASYLNLCGAKVKGAGSSTVTVEGVQKLCAFVEYKPSPDRIETGTFILATLATGGKTEILNANAQNVKFLLNKFSHNTCKMTINNGIIYSDRIYIEAGARIGSVKKIKTAPYPKFPTDLQPITVCASSVFDGVTEVTETVFDSRFSYLDELKKFGASVALDKNTVTVKGVSKLYGAKVTATDLRGGAGLMLAGLCAEGETTVFEFEHVLRGYENIDAKLKGLGADVKLIRGGKD